MKTRTGAGLLALGAAVLLYRTLSMIFLEEALILLMSWVIVSIFIEMTLDAACLITSLRWAVTLTPAHEHLPLRLGAAAAILHALRVLVYVLGRTGPWVDFDRRPEFRGLIEPSWFWVTFAAVLSIMGIAGVIVISSIRRRTHRNTRLTSS